MARYATALAHALADDGAPSARIEVDAIIRRRRAGQEREPAGLVGLAVRVTGCMMAADSLRATVRGLVMDWLAGGALPPGMGARVVLCTVRPRAPAAEASSPLLSPAIPSPPRADRAAARTGDHQHRARRLLAVVALGAGVAVILVVVRPFTEALGVDRSPLAAGEAARPANPTAIAGSTPGSRAAVVARADAPTVAPTPVPTVSVAPAAVATAESTPIAASQATAEPAGLGTGDPVQTVRSFYLVLGQRDYDHLPGLLSGRLRDTVPWQPDVLRQRTPPGQLTMERADLVSQDENDRLATVAVRVREMIWPGSDRSRTYVGTWQLVRGPSGWLLDGSNLQVVDDGQDNGG